MKKFTRSKNNKILFGICGGLAEYYNTDPIIVRLITLLLFFLSGFIPLFLVYVVAIFIVPIEGEDEKKSKRRQKNFLYFILILLALFVLIPILLMLIGFSLFKVQNTFNVESYSPRHEQIQTDHIRVY